LFGRLCGSLLAALRKNGKLGLLVAPACKQPDSFGSVFFMQCVAALHGFQSSGGQAKKQARRRLKACFFLTDFLLYYLCPCNFFPLINDN
jgi:hypothetical protein